MEKYKAIPEGYMTVGQIAKKMNVTVRTLQYYDKEGILSPSSESEGGRRLYTSKDMVKLHQIQSMKYLGFSLEDIKSKLPGVNTPQEVSSALTQQAKGIREKIKSLKDVLKSVEMLNEEVMQMDTVNWDKYADITEMLQSKFDGYWVLKHLSDNAMTTLRDRYIGDDDEAQKISHEYIRLMKEVARIQKNGHKPDSEQAQTVAKDFWKFVSQVTDGDPKLLPELVSMGDNLDDNTWKDKFSFDKSYIGEAIGVYLTNIGYDVDKLSLN